MNRDEARNLIVQGRYQNYVWFEQPHGVADCVAIYEEHGLWNVANTDERAVVGAVRAFDNEEDALELFIHRLQPSTLL